MSKLLIILWTVLLCIQLSSQVNPGQITLLWTEKSMGAGEVRLMGVVGDPDDWLRSDDPEDWHPTAQASPANIMVKYTSYRIALGFRHMSQELYFSDRGFKEIFRLKLLNMPTSSSYSYNVTLEPVFTGTSTNVYGVAVDWLTGMLYWTDSVYNWISVAHAHRTNQYKHLIYTDVEKPMGIVVVPQEGYLFWGDYGVSPKIERSMLDGSDRRVIYANDVQRPLGMSVDTEGRRVFWVDDMKDSIEWIDFDGTNHGHHDLGAHIGHHTLFGIATYKNYVFVTDQFSMSVKAFNMSANMSMIKDIVLTLAIPYDLILYHEDLQEAGPDPCAALQCYHLCLGLGGGRARCDCKQGYELQDDDKTCRPEAFMKPLLVYSIGDEICTAKANMVDRQNIAVSADVNCFLSGMSHVQAMAVNVYEEVLYMSDTGTNAIYKLQLDAVNGQPEMIIANTGLVKGIAIDYVASNMYWSDSARGTITVARLDGSFPYILKNNIVGLQSVDIDVPEKTLYWTTTSAIMMSNLDGSNERTFTDKEVYSADGLVVDSTARKVYWTDSQNHLITVREMDTGLQTKLFGRQGAQRSFRDVTVFQDYIMWTDGANGVFMGRIDKIQDGALRAFNHADKNVSHDIVTYDYYLQPQAPSPCDMENGNCEQLCLSSEDTTRVCKCGIGYHLANGKCTSEIVYDDFVLMVDSSYNSLYQLNLNGPSYGIQAAAMETANTPKFLAYDETTSSVYWYETGESVIRRDNLRTRMESTISVFTHHATLTGMTIHSAGKKLFFTDEHRVIYTVDLLTKERSEYFRSTAFILPDTIDVSPEDDCLYWIEIVQGSQMVTKLALDGSNPMIHIGVVKIDPGLKGMKIDHHGSKIYYWSNSRVHMSTLGLENMTTIYNDEGTTISSLDVMDGDVYFADVNKNALFQFSSSDSTTLAAITPPLLSRIDYLITYKTWVPPSTTAGPTTTTKSTSSAATAGTPSKGTKPPGTPTSTQPTTTVGKQGTNLYIIVGACAGGIILMVAIIAAVCVVRRRKTKRQPPKVQYNVEAHDNPVYMSHNEVQQGGVGTGAVGGAASSEQQADALPEKKELPDGYVVSPGEMPSILGPDAAPSSPEASHGGGMLQELPEEDDAYMVPHNQDMDQLVADNAHVVLGLDIDGADTAVSYQAKTE